MAELILKITGLITICSLALFISSVCLYLTYKLGDEAIRKLWSEKEIIVGIIQARGKTDKINTDRPIKVSDGHYKIEKVDRYDPSDSGEEK